MALLRPGAKCERNRKHCQTHDGEAWNREQKIAHQPTQRGKVLTSEWKAPLEQQQQEEQAREQWTANVIHEQNWFHDLI